MQPAHSRMRPPVARTASTNLSSSSGRSGSAAPTSRGGDSMRHVGTSTGAAAGAGRTAGVTQGKRRAKEDGGSNIQVCVRVRGQAEGELPVENPILTTEGTHGPKLKVDVDPARVYNFDTVFSSDASQGMVYQHVVSPILEQVLKGYNCTIFAYGQTGTGKTHTMEGNLAENLGTYHTEAGIIPRVLYKLFYTLDKLDPTGEYTVTATFVELYNEELRNLLGESTSLISTSQSSGKANLRTGPQGGLRILDNDNGGVTIQGLNEVPMSNADSGLKLLREGSEKRHIAATRCNENSSRSHSVLTLTVYIQDTSVENEVVFRTGKLNLVDLAGSENIGRSGAENTRAREAGMINQSLLTLGRVINALVERSPHVPYRESKLTRLLQESLGGRTKTCIIATVSADSSNAEETISTLDYALRAKSILNKPEMNTSMTRAGLLKDFVTDIERLRKDVIAAREKNGIFLSEESYKTSQTALEEARRAADSYQHEKGIMESKLTDLQGQLEQRLQLLGKRDQEVKIAKAEVDKYVTELKNALRQLSDVNQRLDDECTLREAYMQSERKLDRVALRLRSTAQESLKDVDGLFAKLDRKSAVEEINGELTSECQRSLSAMGAELEARVTEQRAIVDRFSSNLTSQLSALVKSQEQELSSKEEHMKTQLASLSEASKKLRASHSAAQSDVLDAADQVDGAREILHETAQQQISALRSARDLLLNGMKSQLASQAKAITDCFTQVAKEAEGLAALAKEQTASIGQRVTEVHVSVRDTMAGAAVAQSNLSDQLKRVLEEERAADARDRETVNALMLELAEKRQAEREANLQRHQRDARSLVEQNGAAITTQMSTLDTISRNSDMLRDAIVAPAMALGDITVRGKSIVENGVKDAALVHDKFDKEVEETTRAEIQAANEMARSVKVSTSNLRENARISWESHNTELDKLDREANTGIEQLHRSVQADFVSVQETSNAVTAAVHDHHKSTMTFLGNAAGHMSNMRGEGRKFLSERFAVDESTGETPIKRSWDMDNTEWSLVHHDRNTALQQTRASIRRRDAPRVVQTAEDDEMVADQDILTSPRQMRPSYVDDATFIEDEDIQDDTLAAFHAGDTTARPGPRASHLSAASGSSAGASRRASTTRRGGHDYGYLRAGSADTDDDRAAQSVASSSASSPQTELGAKRTREPSSCSGPLSEKNSESHPAYMSAPRRPTAAPANLGLGVGKVSRSDVKGSRAFSAASGVTGQKSKAATFSEETQPAPPKRIRRQ